MEKTPPKNSKVQLADSQQALNEYLQDLLAEDTTATLAEKFDNYQFVEQLLVEDADSTAYKEVVIEHVSHSMSSSSLEPVVAEKESIASALKTFVDEPIEEQQPLRHSLKELMTPLPDIPDVPNIPKVDVKASVEQAILNAEQRLVEKFKEDSQVEERELSSEEKDIQATEEQIRLALKEEIQAVETTKEIPEHIKYEWEQGTRPIWAENKFECLLFSVAGMKLAVPLVNLGGIQRIQHTDMTPLIGQPKWFLGLVSSPSHERQIRVVDTSRWLMPNSYDEKNKEKLEFVIRIEGTDWCLACDDVAESVSLEPDQVHWRAARTHRPWVLGTIVDEMCALLDVEALAWMLSKE